MTFTTQKTQNHNNLVEIMSTTNKHQQSDKPPKVFSNFQMPKIDSFRYGDPDIREKEPLYLFNKPPVPIRPAHSHTKLHPHPRQQVKVPPREVSPSVHAYTNTRRNSNNLKQISKSMEKLTLNNDTNRMRPRRNGDIDFDSYTDIKKKMYTKIPLPQ